MRSLGTINFYVPSDAYGFVEIGHLTLCHAILDFSMGWRPEKHGMNEKGRVLVTGGAGYVGSYLVPKLLAAGYPVNVLDLYLYGEEVLDEVRDNPNLREFRGDLRNPKSLIPP